MEQLPTTTLNPPALETATAKVTVGFRCHPAEKLNLAQEAQDKGFKLSEYVESLIALRHYRPQSETIEQLEEQTRDLRTALDHYEKDPVLLALFRESTGKTLNYPAAGGRTATVTVQNVRDVFTVLVHSFRKEVSHV